MIPSRLLSWYIIYNSNIITGLSCKTASSTPYYFLVMSPASSLPTLKVTNRIRPLADDNGASVSISKSSRPKAQGDKSNSRNKENQEAMEAAIDEWMSHAHAKAHELAQRFDKKPRYFLDRFFQGGQKFIHKHTVTNAFNAFKSIKAAELRAGMLSHDDTYHN